MLPRYNPQRLSKHRDFDYDLIKDISTSGIVSKNRYLHVVSLKGSDYPNIMDDHNTETAITQRPTKGNFLSSVPPHKDQPYLKYRHHKTAADLERASKNCQGKKLTGEFDGKCYMFTTLPVFIDEIISDSLSSNPRGFNVYKNAYHHLQHYLGLHQDWDNHTTIVHALVPLECLFSPTLRTNVRKDKRWVQDFLEMQKRENVGGGVRFTGQGYTLRSDVWGRKGGGTGVPEIIVRPCDIIYYWFESLQETIRRRIHNGNTPITRRIRRLPNELKLAYQDETVDIYEKRANWQKVKPSISRLRQKSQSKSRRRKKTRKRRPRRRSRTRSRRSRR